MLIPHLNNTLKFEKPSMKIKENSHFTVYYDEKKMRNNPFIISMLSKFKHLIMLLQKKRKNKNIKANKIH